MRFDGFGEYAIDFYDGLTADNSRAYWLDNKHTYDSDVKAPMQSLLDELAGEFGEFGKGKIFRPYRDVRFSPNKSPYKTHCGAVFEPGRGGGAFYVEISPEGLKVGGGMFYLHPDQLARYRQSVDEEISGQALEKLVAKLAKSGWTINGDQLKTKPRGYDPDHPRLDLLRHRSIYAMKMWPPDDALHTRETFTRVRAAWRALRPFNEWSIDHVGIHED